MAELFKKAFNKLASEIAPNNPEFQLRELSPEELALKSEQKKAAKAEQKEVAKIAKEESGHGNKVASVMIQDGIGLVRIAIYDRGYIKIGNKIERLLSINGDSQIAKKTGLGRSVATLATFATPFPAFNLLSPGARGRITLTVVTDKQTRIFSTDMVVESTLKDYEKLRAAGSAVLQRIQLESEPNSAQSSQADDLALQLKSLSDLHAQGILSDEEFAAAKAKLLS